MAYSTSTLLFGDEDYVDEFSKNSIYGNSKNADVATWYTQYSSYIFVYSNWWGSYPPDNNKFSKGVNGVLEYTPALNYDPWLLLQKPGTFENIASVGNSEISTVSDDLINGTKLRLNGKYKDAKDFFISYLSKHPDNQRANVELYNCYSKETAVDIIKYFNTLPTVASKDLKLLLANLYIKEDDFESAKKANNNIIDENLNTPLSERAKINNLLIALYNENNLDNAETIYKDILSKPELSSTSELSDIEYAIKTYEKIFNKKDSNLPDIQKSFNADEKPKMEIPNEYSLLGNYPNPFNPSTTISYYLPQTSAIEIDIFDLLGNKIKSFSSSAQSAGKQGIVWDGTNNNNEQVSSGIYFYHFKAVSLEGKDEVFEKTAKLLLLK